jgi:Xaa-Pro aminopeptidase
MAMTAAGVAATAAGGASAQRDQGELKPLTGGAKPIGTEERLARIARAQRLMRQHKLSALLIEPGASLTYFTGVKWRRSERLTAAVIPAQGEIAIVTPHFEEPSVRESLKVPGEVRVWNEDEDPLRTVAGFLRDRKATGDIGVEETVRYFASTVSPTRCPKPGSGAPTRSFGRFG